MAVPLVLLHGYDSSFGAYNAWDVILKKAGFDVENIFIGNYVTLNNEITVDDIAEGFDRALRARGMEDKPFDIVVHSTGMLVLRSWLTAPGAVNRQTQLKHLIALAPATNGSPVATKGRSLLGRIFLGNHTLGPDFLNSGNLVLDNLELASKYTWDLAHKDLFGPKCLYDDTPGTPYVFIFDGTDDYGKLAEIFDEDDQLGTDGVVRWAGASLNSQKITLDFTHHAANPERFTWSDSTNPRLPLIPIAGVHHNKILSVPPDGLQSLVIKALRVASADDLTNFYREVDSTDVVKKGHAKIDADPWQQFIVHAVDERGKGINDYSVEVLLRDPEGNATSISAFEKYVHPYGLDNSFRAFHVRLRDALTPGFGDANNKIIVRIHASSGTDLLRYEGTKDTNASNGTDFVQLDISAQARSTNKQLFFPFTTTMLEIRLNREPVPLKPAEGGGIALDYEIFQFKGFAVSKQNPGAPLSFVGWFIEMIKRGVAGLSLRPGPG